MLKHVWSYTYQKIPSTKIKLMIIKPVSPFIISCMIYAVSRIFVYLFSS